MFTSETKQVLRNYIRHSETHNRIVEEGEMWRQWNAANPQHEIPPPPLPPPLPPPVPPPPAFNIPPPGYVIPAPGVIRPPPPPPPHHAGRGFVGHDDRGNFPNFGHHDDRARFPPPPPPHPHPPPPIGFGLRDEDFGPRGPGRAHMDEEPQPLPPPLPPRSTYWMRELHNAEEKDPERWGHNGYRELYPEEFRSDHSDKSSDDGRQTRSKNRRSESKYHRTRHREKHGHKSSHREEKHHQRKRDSVEMRKRRHARHRHGSSENEDSGSASKHVYMYGRPRHTSHSKKKKRKYKYGAKSSVRLHGKQPGSSTVPDKHGRKRPHVSRRISTKEHSKQITKQKSGKRKSMEAFSESESDSSVNAGVAQVGVAPVEHQNNQPSTAKFKRFSESQSSSVSSISNASSISSSDSELDNHMVADGCNAPTVSELGHTDPGSQSNVTKPAAYEVAKHSGKCGSHGSGSGKARSEKEPGELPDSDSTKPDSGIGNDDKAAGEDVRS